MIQKCLAAVDDDEPRWFYCSFATAEAFLGAIVTYGRASEICPALWEKGINPGGEAVLVPLKDEQLPDTENRDVLLPDLPAIKAAFGDRLKLGWVGVNMTTQKASLLN